MKNIFFSIFGQSGETSIEPLILPLVVGHKMRQKVAILRRGPVRVKSHRTKKILISRDSPSQKPPVNRVWALFKKIEILV